ncbi:hypothetical protein VD0002_g779 [Verticillium dahliae]|nr:hypothetical protein BJF96_g2997 [Verticillium dahliae]PNH55753.1 hypothetical protein VD0003_g1906 [Verticillium dahliae]PNH69660.1 hypothetical protein VD0002_g779 [Verticillium dahliae]
MGIIRTVATIVLSIAFFVFVLFFGRLPALRNTPVAALYKLLFVRVPDGLVALDRIVTSGRLSRSLSRFGNHIMYDRHPTIVMFFFGLLLGAEYLYLPSAWPQMSTSHRVFGSISVFLPYLFLYLAVNADPGYITPENHAYYMSLYPYDYSIFHPGHKCSTCGFIKPPRSKHCSICKRCIAKCDHHCIFINGCVGYENHKWFVLLLLSTAILTTYGGALGYSILTAKIRARFPAWSVWPPSSLGWEDYFLIWSWGLQDDVSMGAVTLLSSMTTPLVWGLLIYTLWLIYCGTTTNESLKWTEWKEDMDDGLAFKRSMSTNRTRDPLRESATSRWPLDTQQVLVTTENGMPPAAGGPGQGEWERIWKMRDVENLYDMGLWDNMMDVFVKDYAFGKRRDQPPIEDEGRPRQPLKASRF